VEAARAAVTVREWERRHENGDVVAMIKAIAAQTELLAHNAAIESPPEQLGVVMPPSHPHSVVVLSQRLHRMHHQRRLQSCQMNPLEIL
jgi:hypothetical protein